jgi:hypothetical protein
MVVPAHRYAMAKNSAKTYLDITIVSQLGRVNPIALICSFYFLEAIFFGPII